MSTGKNIVYEAIVVGAGIVGSAAAYQISKFHEPTLLLEQFELLHKRGSSHGNSRIIRYSYPETIYAKMGVIGLELWKQAEKESKMRVYHQKGGIDIGYENEENIMEVIDSAKQNGYPIEVFNTKESITKRFPLLKYKPGMIVVYQETSGILNAAEAVRMFQFLAAKNGCLIHEREKLLSYRHMNDSEINELANLDVNINTVDAQDYLFVKTDKKSYITKKLILCCGAWARQVISQYNHHASHDQYPIHSNSNQQKPVLLNAQVQLLSYGFWKVKKEYEKLWKEMPIWIHYERANEEGHFGEYGFPIFEQEMKGHVKAALHYTLPNERGIDPDNRTFEMPLEKMKATKKFLQSFFDENSFEFESFEDMKKQNKTMTCLYTSTPSSDFVIDTHPLNKNVVIFAGGSGHAFKFGPLLGLFMYHLMKEPHAPLLLNQLDRTTFSIHNFLASSGPISKL